MTRKQYERVFSDRSKLRGAYFWFKSRDNLWWLGIIHTVGSANEPFVVRFLDEPGPVKILLRPELYSTDPSAERFSWCLQYRKSSGIASGVMYLVEVGQICRPSRARLKFAPLLILSVVGDEET